MTVGLREYRIFLWVAYPFTQPSFCGQLCCDCARVARYRYDLVCVETPFDLKVQPALLPGRPCSSLAFSSSSPSSSSLSSTLFLPLLTSKWGAKKGSKRGGSEISCYICAGTCVRASAQALQPPRYQRVAGRRAIRLP